MRRDRFDRAIVDVDRPIIKNPLAAALCARTRGFLLPRCVARRGGIEAASRRAYSGSGGASTSRLPLMPIGDTRPAASICSTSRAARL